MKPFLLLVLFFSLNSYGQLRDVSTVVFVNKYDVYIGGGFGINSNYKNQLDVHVLLGMRNTYFANAVHPALLLSYSHPSISFERSNIYFGLQFYASHLPIASQYSIKSDLGLHVGFEVGERWKWSMQFGPAIGIEFYSLGRQRYINFYGATKLSYAL